MTAINSSMFSTVILTLSFGMIFPCTYGNKILRIVGGEKTFPGEIPAMAALLKGSKKTCGGSILNDYCILTAAHCFDKTQLTHLYKFAVGAYNIKHLEQDEHSKVYNVTKIIIHPNYNFDDDSYNDVAIACAEIPIQYSDFVENIFLPEANNSDYCPYATVYGWGRTSEEGLSSDILLKVNVSSINNKKCKSQYSIIKYAIQESQICFGDDHGGRDSCGGDSGGPLICNIGSNIGKQIGIVSLGVGCAQAAFPGVYTSVAHFLVWIKETLNQHTNSFQ